MPAITVSAVNTGTDTLTATAHGLTTGDRFRLRNVGGALPAATPALAAVTDYFAIVTDANNLKVSDTNANALAGTGVVNITGTGTGTTTVEYGLPFCIPRIATPQSQKYSADDNATWNTLVALYDLLTGQPQPILPATMQGPFRPITIFPAVLSVGNNNNWNPAGLDSAGIIRLTNANGASATITGIAAPAAPADGRLLTIYSSIGDTITFSHNDSNSSAANRLFFPGLANVTMTTNQAWSFVYDATTAVWRPLAKNF